MEGRGVIVSSPNYYNDLLECFYPPAFILLVRGQSK